MQATTVRASAGPGTDGAYHNEIPGLIEHAVHHRNFKLAAFARNGYPGRHLPSQMLAGLQSLGYWDAAATQNWGTGWACIEDLVIGFLGRGRLDCSIGAKAYSLKSGNLFIIPPGQPHCLGAAQLSASRLHWLLLDLKARRPGEPWAWPSWVMLSRKELKHLTLLLRRSMPPLQPTNPILRKCFDQMVAWVPQLTALEAETRIKIWVNTLLLELLRMLESDSPTLGTLDNTVRGKVDTFLRSLPENVAQSWSLDSMASYCGLGRSRFAYYCEELTNLSPLKYLIRCRLEKAARLLLGDRARSVTAIAFECGFQSSQYFTTTFHHAFGCAPSDYRQRRPSGKPPPPTH